MSHRRTVRARSAGRRGAVRRSAPRVARASARTVRTAGVAARVGSAARAARFGRATVGCAAREGRTAHSADAAGRGRRGAGTSAATGRNGATSAARTRIILGSQRDGRDRDASERGVLRVAEHDREVTRVTGERTSGKSDADGFRCRIAVAPDQRAGFRGVVRACERAAVRRRKVDAGRARRAVAAAHAEIDARAAGHLYIRRGLVLDGTRRVRALPEIQEREQRLR